MESGNDDLSRYCEFFANYAVRLLSSGATCQRVRKNVGRMADAYCLHVVIAILPAHVSVSVRRCGNFPGNVNRLMEVQGERVDFNRSSLLSNLSWQIAGRQLSLAKAEEEMNRILAAPAMSSWRLLFLVTIANIGFCLIFGGDWCAAIIVGCATAVGMYVRLELSMAGVDIRIILIACSFVSSIVGSAGYVFDCGRTPDVALGTSVLYLIPGIAYLNGVCDLFDGHCLCAFSRLVHGIILTVCITIGLSLGFMLMQIGILK